MDQTGPKWALTWGREGLYSCHGYLLAFLYYFSCKQTIWVWFLLAQQYVSPTFIFLVSTPNLVTNSVEILGWTSIKPTWQLVWGYFSTNLTLYKILQPWFQLSVILCAGAAKQAPCWSAQLPSHDFHELFILLVQAQTGILQGNSTHIKTRNVCAKKKTTTTTTEKVVFYKVIRQYFSSSQCSNIALMVIHLLNGMWFVAMQTTDFFHSSRSFCYPLQ